MSLTRACVPPLGRQWRFSRRPSARDRNAAVTFCPPPTGAAGHFVSEICPESARPCPKASTNDLRVQAERLFEPLREERPQRDAVASCLLSALGTERSGERGAAVQTRSNVGLSVLVNAAVVLGSESLREHLVLPPRTANRKRQSDDGRRCENHRADDGPHGS